MLTHEHRTALMWKDWNCKWTEKDIHSFVIKWLFYSQIMRKHSEPADICGKVRCTQCANTYTLNLRTQIEQGTPMNFRNYNGNWVLHLFGGLLFTSIYMQWSTHIQKITSSEWDPLVWRCKNLNSRSIAVPHKFISGRDFEFCFRIKCALLVSVYVRCDAKINSKRRFYGMCNFYV